MKPLRKLLAIGLLSLTAGVGFGLVRPSTAAAEKLPVDCSGRKSACTTIRTCSQWINHVCYEYTTNFWYWYF